MHAITDGVASGCRGLQFECIDNLTGNDIVMLSQVAQIALGICIDRIEITQNKHQATRTRNPAQTQQGLVQMTGFVIYCSMAGACLCQVRCGVSGRDQFPDQAQYPARTAQWTYFMMATIKQQGTDTVAVLYRCPANQGSRTGSNHRFEGAPGCEEHTRAKVDHHHHRALAFLLIEFDVRMSGTGGYPPVHAADIIPRLINP